MKSIVIIMVAVMVSLACNLFAKEHMGPDELLDAARAGDVDAMCDLGRVYFYGKGTLKDPFKAKCWVKKAYDHGSNQARALWQELKLWEYSGKCEDTFDDDPVPKFFKGSETVERVLGMVFVYVPKGCFKMGCHPEAGKCNSDEKPPHTVCLDGFWMGKYEVSQEQWVGVMGENPSRFNRDLRHPVENVTFMEIQKFIRMLNAKTRDTFSLPTEAQWEYACKNGGETVTFPWGNESYRPDANCGTCNSGDFYGETAPVGSFSPNGLGLYDMAGNVREWCRDVYDKKAYLSHEKQNPVYEGKGTSRVVRGGSFADNASQLRCTNREKSLPGMRMDSTGFRLVLTRQE